MNQLQKNIEKAIQQLGAERRQSGKGPLSGDREQMLHQLHHFVDSKGVQGSEGVRMIKKCVLDIIQQHPDIKAAELRDNFALNSCDSNGKNRGWFVWVILRQLQKEKKVIDSQVGREKCWRAVTSSER